MSENSNIYNIVKRLYNSDSIREDLNEAVCLLEKHFKHKYFSPIEQDIICCSKDCKSEPTKEITLLKACKPFTSRKDNIDNVINLINTVRTFSRLYTDYSKNISSAIYNKEISAQAIKDSAIHKDGIYEIDEDCGVNTSSKDISDNNILIILLLIMLLNK